MHYCPECGQACYCGGDLDDCEMPEGEERCTCPCDELDDEDYYIGLADPEEDSTAPSRGATDQGEGTDG